MSLPEIELVPMSGEEFDAWRDHSIREYAADHVRSGNWSEEESIGRATAEFATLLPNGAQSPNHYVWSVRDTRGESVGILWVATDRLPGQAFIYDIEMVEQRRGEGFGTAALLALDAWAREHGITSILLHVFAHNTGAWQLYKRLGYVETNVNMEKRL